MTVKDKNINIDLESLNLNGVIHVGTSEKGEYARYYHRLGIHTVIWVDNDHQSYALMYEHTRNFGMEQKIIIEPANKRFVEVWRENASFIDPYSYDLLHVTTKNKVQVIEGFDWLIENFKAVVASNLDESAQESLDKLMEEKGFIVDSYTDQEKLYIRNH